MDDINRKQEKSGEENLLKIVYGDCTLGIWGKAGEKTFHYIFSYQTGGMESLCIDGKEWLYRTPKPVFWRALTDNDRGNKFYLKSGSWMSADLFIDCVKIDVAVDGKEIPLPIAPVNNQFDGREKAKELMITFTYETITIPKTYVKAAYKIDSEGKILVTVQYEGKKGLPELPVFGMRFLMPTKAEGYSYEGLSGETYPDRKAGGEAGIFHIEGMPVTPYLVPQDCGMHMDTKWVEVQRRQVLNPSIKNCDLFRLKFSAVKEPFAFNCLPYTAQELENALHQEELPIPRRTVLCIYGAVRGVGGIDSWGAEVEEAYRIYGDKNIYFSFEITP